MLAHNKSLKILEQLLTNALNSIIEEERGEETVIEVYEDSLCRELEVRKNFTPRKMNIVIDLKEPLISIITRSIDLSINGMELTLHATTIYEPKSDIMYEYPQTYAPLGGYIPSPMAIRAPINELMISKNLIKIPHNITQYDFEFLVQHIITNIWFEKIKRESSKVIMLSDTPIFTLDKNNLLKLKLKLMKQLHNKGCKLISITWRLSPLSSIINSDKSALHDIDIIKKKVIDRKLPLVIGPATIDCDNLSLISSYIIIPVVLSEEAYKYVVLRLETLNEVYNEFEEMYLESWITYNYLTNQLSILRIPKSNTYRILRTLLSILEIVMRRMNLSFTQDTLYKISQLKDIEGYFLNIL